MSQPTAELDRYFQPKQGSIDMGPDMLAVSYSSYNPNVITRWRTDQYQAAVNEVLAADSLPEVRDEMAIGCAWAANRASTYFPYQTGTESDGFGRSAEIRGHESAILRLIGTEKFVQLQTMAPPAELIDGILNTQGNPHTGPGLKEITVAVIKKQIPWEDRFAAAGVPLPANVIAEDTAWHDQHRAGIREFYAPPPTPAPSRWRLAAHRLLNGPSS